MLSKSSIFAAIFLATFLILSVFLSSNTVAAAISVKDFGAKGDGVTDDSVAIQNAFNSLGSNGGTIYFPAGTYMLGTSHGGTCCYPDGSLIQNALILNRNNVIITGDGTGVSILKLMPHTKMLALLISSSNVIVEKITIDGNGNQRNGTVGWPNGDVVNALTGSTDTTNNVTYRYCEVKNGIEDGFGCSGCQNAYIHDCYFHDLGIPTAGGAGISIHAYGGKVVHNIIVNNTFGIWTAYGSHDILIQDNLIANISFIGMIIGHDYKIFGANPGNARYNITGNIVEGSGNPIWIACARDGSITNNTVINNYNYGILIFDCTPGVNSDYSEKIPSSNWIISNNVCSNTDLARRQAKGIVVGASFSNNIILRGNDCENNGNSIDDQISIQNPSAVNSDWRSVNTISYTPVNQDPKGTLDAVDCSSFAGWTCDPDNYAQAIDVYFFKDGPYALGGTLIGSTTANLQREQAVGDQCGGYRNHGFVFNTPDSLKDGISHTIYAYAINTPAGNNPQLSGSPKTLSSCVITSSSTTTTSSTTATSTTTIPISSTTTTSTSIPTTSSTTTTTLQECKCSWFVCNQNCGSKSGNYCILDSSCLETTISSTTTISVTSTTTPQTSSTTSNQITTTSTPTPKTTTTTITPPAQPCGTYDIPCWIGYFFLRIFGLMK
jgi:hypothetical protein